MAISGVHHNFRDGTLTLSDATGSPITATIQYEAGDLNISGLKEGMAAYTGYPDRGKPGGAGSYRKTTWEPATFSFSCHMTDLTDATEKTVLDAAMKTGAFASGVSTLGANADLWTLKLVWTVESSSYGDVADHVCTFYYVRITDISISEGDPNTFSISGDILCKDTETDGYLFAST